MILLKIVIAWADHFYISVFSLKTSSQYCLPNKLPIKETSVYLLIQGKASSVKQIPNIEHKILLSSVILAKDFISTMHFSSLDLSTV